MNNRKVKITLEDEELHLALEYTVGQIAGEREFLRRCQVSGLHNQNSPKALSLLFANGKQISLFEASLQFDDLVDAIKILVQLEATVDHRLMMEYLNRLNYAKQQHAENSNLLVSCLSIFRCGAGFAKPKFAIEPADRYAKKD